MVSPSFPVPKLGHRQFTIANDPIELLVHMLKQQTRQAVLQPPERTHRTTGINLPIETWELLRRVAFERSRRGGGGGSLSALLVELGDRH